MNITSVNTKSASSNNNSICTNTNKSKTTNINNNNNNSIDADITNISNIANNTSTTSTSSTENHNESSELNRMNSKKRKRVVNMLVRSVGNPIQQGYVSSGIGKASFVHALVVIFLEFFAWGLLTDQVITVLNETFPNSTFLANGLIHGLKGILSFLSAPLIGALSDIWGRKVFLLITVFFTCLPIPLMRINTMWYFAMISISGLFAVTFSVVFAYVADVTDEKNRTTAYGLVSATFAASLITSPALGSYLSRFYSENFVIALATAIAVFDLFFILVAVPESLPEKIRERSKSISWENVDPFKSLKAIFADRTITLLCFTVFLSYLPEAGQYSCFFVYLRLIVGFSQEQVAYFIAYVGILSCIAQAAVLIVLIRYFGSKQSIIIGLTFQVLQLASYGFAAQQWLIWFSGLLAAISSIGYPAISAFISNKSTADQQGVSQGCVTGIRGLCNGIGPAMYGFIFWIFNVNLNDSSPQSGENSGTGEKVKATYASTHLLPGPPFLFGSVLALMAILIIWLIPSDSKTPILISSRSNKEKTVVKIGNTSNTYNRSSSTSSMHITATTGLLSAEGNVCDQSNGSDIMTNSQELEPFLLNELQTKSILHSTSTSALSSGGGGGPPCSNALNNILIPSNLVSNSSNLINSGVNHGDLNSIHTGSTYLNNNPSYNNEGSLASSYSEYTALKILGKINKDTGLQSTSANININETNRTITINSGANNSNTPPVASSPSNSFASQFDLSTTTLSLSKSFKSLDMPTSKFFVSSHKTNVD